MKRIVVGAGAQGRVVLEMWRAQHPHDEFLFLDDSATLHGSAILGAPVAGPVSSIGTFEGAAEAVVAIGNNRIRLAVADRFGIQLGIVIHPSAVISPSSVIGAGTVVFAGAIVGTQAKVGANVILNTGVIIEHDATVEDGASFSPGTKTGGRIHVGRGAFLATGVTLAPRVRVGAWSVVGAGSVVVRDIASQTLAHGVPARPVRAIDDSFDWQTLL